MNKEFEEQFRPGRSKALDEWFDQRFDARFAEKMTAADTQTTPSLSIMVTKGTLDWAYPPFVIASTAAAVGWKVVMFFTFYGLALLRKELTLTLSPIGNPAMPMKMPFGPPWFRDLEWHVPNLVMAGVPGFERMATALMLKTIRNRGVATVEELRQICIEADVKFIGCQMTAELFGLSRDTFIPEVAEWAGAATYLQLTQRTNVNLFV